MYYDLSSSQVPGVLLHVVHVVHGGDGDDGGLTVAVGRRREEEEAMPVSKVKNSLKNKRSAF